MRKKMISSIIVGILLVMNLTACGTSEEVSSNAITYASPDSEIGVVSLKVWGAEEDYDLLSQLIERFKQENGEEWFDITIEAVTEAECREKILSDITVAPDVFTFVDDQIMTLAAAGVLEPIANQAQVIETNLEGAVEAATLNETIYAYPITADNGYFMYYNKNYFSEEDVKSLDRMLEIAKSHNKKIAMDWSKGWYIYSFFGNTGLTLGLKDDYLTNYCNWNATEGEIKGTDVVEGMRKIASHSAFTSLGSDGFVSGAEAGEIIAGVSGIWDAVPIEAAWQEGYAATKLPTYTVAGKQVQMASYAGYKMIGVNAYSKHAEWADKLAQYLSSEQSQLERFYQRGQGPSNINAAKSKEVNESIAIKALIEQSEFASAQRVGPQYWSASSKLGEALASGDLQGLTDQQLLDQAVEGITAHMKAD